MLSCCHCIHLPHWLPSKGSRRSHTANFTPCPHHTHSNASILAAIADKDNAVVSINASGIIQMANKSAERLLGACQGINLSPSVHVAVGCLYSNMGELCAQTVHTLTATHGPLQATRRVNWRARTSAS